MSKPLEPCFDGLLKDLKTMINVFMKINPTQTVPYEGKYPTRDKPKSKQLTVCITKLTFWWHNY